MSYNLKKLYFLFEIIINLSLFIFGNNQEQKSFNNVLFPTTLTLLNQNIVMVQSDGIHFYTSELVEDTSKTITFENKISNIEENEKVSMAQFSEKDKGYIMILTNETMYFFESDGTIINITNLKDSIFGSHYCLIPFKKENNYLYYLISYQSIGSLTIKQFKFNINYHVNEIIMSNDYIVYNQYHKPNLAIPNKIIGINCIFLSTSTINNDILTCFYAIYYPTEIHAMSFDPYNNFTELTELFSYYYKGENFPLIYYISAITNQDKQKALVFGVSENSFWMTFSFEESFSEHKQIFNDSSLSLALIYHKTKIYYFRQTHEFLFSSSVELCKNYVMIFNNNFTIKNQGYSSPNSCYNCYYHSAFFDGTYYNIVNDNGNIDNPKIYVLPIIDFGISSSIESLIIIEKDTTETNDLKTYPIIQTTINDDNSISYHNSETTIIYNDNKEINKKTEITTQTYTNNGNSIINYQNIGTIIPNIDNQDINQKTLISIQNNINKDNLITYQNVETNIVDNEFINKTKETTVIRKDITEIGKQNINKTSEIIVINGEFYSCSNEDFYMGECDLINDRISKKDMIEKIRDDITNHKIDDLLSNITDGKGEDLIIENNKTIYQLTSSYNQNNKVYHNISTIKLGKCEFVLKDKYNIDYKTPLIIFKVDNNEKGSTIPIVEYEIYESVNYTKLDLNLCKNLHINIDIPILIDENNIFKYNLSSDYYKDICIPATSKNDTDIILSDRVDEYYKENMSLCEQNCTYNGYNLELKNTDCECEIKTEINIDSHFIFDKAKLLNNFINIKNIANIEVLKCYKILFSKQGFKNNYGNYIILAILLFHIISLIYFIIKGFNLFIKKTESLMKAKKRNSIFRKYKTRKRKSVSHPPKKIKYKKRKSHNIDISKSNGNDFTDPSMKIRLNNFRRSLNIRKQTKNIESFSLKYKRISIYKNNNINNMEINNFMNNSNYDNYELNIIKYEEALILDKRSFIQVYASLLRTKHLILFTFFNDNDYNSYIIKISFFFISFALYLTVNVLFFNDSTMHKIYLNEGKYNFIYQIPSILYTTVISAIINYIIKNLSLTEKNILELRYEKKNINKKLIKVLKCISIKFGFFYLFTFILLVFFWFYLSCFCAVYINSQKYIITDALISFGLSLLYPFLFNIISCILRMLSLNHKTKCIYNISQLI